MSRSTRIAAAWQQGFFIAPRVPPEAEYFKRSFATACIEGLLQGGIPIRTSVYEHQIVIWNSAGGLDHGMPAWQASFGVGQSLARQCILSGGLYRILRGIEKIVRECQVHGIEPPGYDFEMSGQMLTFKANLEHLSLALGKQAAQALLGQDGNVATGAVTGSVTDLAVNPLRG